MVECPYGLGRLGQKCVCSGATVDYNTTKVIYTERRSDFKFETDVYIQKCSRK